MSFRKISASWLVIFFSLVTTLVLGLSSHSAAVEAGPDWISSPVSVEFAGDYDTSVPDWSVPFANVPTERQAAQFYDGSKDVQVSKIAFPTLAGHFYSDFALPLGETKWQYVNKGDYYDASFFASPARSGVLVITHSAYPYYTGIPYMYYVDDWRTMFSDLKVSNHMVTRSVGSGFQLGDYPTLRKANGTQLVIDSRSAVAFSKNGEWFYANSDIGQLRVHIPDLQYQIVGARLITNYSLSSAASNSGRYVAAGNKEKTLTLYDTTRCSSQTAADCASIDLGKIARTKFSQSLASSQVFMDFSVVGVKFETESKLKMFAYVSYYDKSSAKTVNKYVVLYVGVDPGPHTTRYLALGDSFSSGEGAGSYYVATDFYADAANYNLCHQSKDAYSEVLARQLSLDWYDSIACSGAMMKDMVYDTTKSDEEYIRQGGPQARTPNSDSMTIGYFKNSIIPGYVPQLSVLNVHGPTVSTLTIGGNDIGFGDIVKDCVFSLGCYSSRDDREKLADLIDGKIPYLEVTFKTILSDMSGDNPRLYVLGYPQLFNPYTVCASFMNGNERLFANNLVDYLNDALRIAARRAGAQYIDVTNAFVDSNGSTDYRLCGNARIAANGLVVDIKNMSDAQPAERLFSSSYHPNALGHKLIAERVKLLTNNLTKGMPPRYLSETKPDMAHYTTLVGDAENRFNTVINFGEITGQYVFFENNRNVDISYTTSEHDGSPVVGTTVTVTVQSEPIVLGKLTVEAGGLIKTSSAHPIQLPAGLHTGMHRLHLLFTDIQGRSRDVVQYVYLFASRDDLDGDGIPNRQEQCAIGGAMGMDYDEDGIDDVCDESVADKPAAPNSEPNEPDPTSTGSGIVTTPTYQPIPQMTAQNSLLQTNPGVQLPQDISLVTGGSENSNQSQTSILGNQTQDTQRIESVGKAQNGNMLPSQGQPQDIPQYAAIVIGGGSILLLLAVWRSKHKHV